MKYKLIILPFLLISAKIISQDSFSYAETKLARYNDYFENADAPKHRIAAYKKFVSLFEKTLQKDNSFNFPFDSLKWVSKFVPPDSSFRIFSWQLDIDGDKKEYSGYIQKKDGTLYKLNDNKEWFSDLEYAVFTPDDWYGQLYYNLYQYRNNGHNEYILFGYKQLSRYDKIKIAAPVYFKNGMVYFGKEIFQDTLRKEGLKNRIILQTISEAASKLNYDENMGIIIYDHTIAIPLNRPAKAGPPLVPDGSYHGYKWDGTKWKFIDKVFHTQFNEKEIPGRKSDKKKRDLFGKEIKD